VNLYLRLLWLLLRLPFVPRRPVLESSRLVLRVWPTDCDMNFHMNNGRYLTLMDLGRTHLVAQTGLLGILFKRRWAPVLAAAEINFIRALPPLARFELVSRVVTWDEKYFYMEQRFERAGVLHAVAFVRGVFLKGRNRIPTAQVVAALDPALRAPPMPAALRHWKDMGELKKQHTAAA
jgi:acyl-CoA thioesterase FadM